MTRVKQSSETTSWRQRLDENVVQNVVDDRAGPLEVNGVDTLVVSIVLITVQVLFLASVAGEMEHQRIVGLGSLDQPLTSLDDVLLGGDRPLITLVVGENHHIVGLVTCPLNEVPLEIVHVVDTPSQGVFRARVVDADEQRLLFARAVGVLEVVPLGVAAEGLLALGRHVVVAVGTGRTRAAVLTGGCLVGHSGVAVAAALTTRGTVIAARTTLTTITALSTTLTTSIIAPLPGRRTLRRSIPSPTPVLTRRRTLRRPIPSSTAISPSILSWRRSLGRAVIAASVAVAAGRAALVVSAGRSAAVCVSSCAWVAHLSVFKSVV